VHLAFGVAIEDGLVTPVIRSAETKGLREIGAEAKALIKKARGKKLTPNEMSGSTLTVTNLGMFGISDFYGIINPNNAAILSIGATIKIGLSGDHRTIDGAVGAQYLQALKEILESPSIMLV
jgi:pyruvate dehydrogenase E2 component (dihydrolipoamide acetyltransferase)